MQEICVKEFRDDMSIVKDDVGISIAIRDFLQSFEYCSDRNQCIQIFLKTLSESNLFTYFLVNNKKFNDVFFKKLYEFSIEIPEIYQEYVNVFSTNIDNINKISTKINYLRDYMSKNNVKNHTTVAKDRSLIITSTGFCQSKTKDDVIKLDDATKLETDEKQVVYVLRNRTVFKK